MNLCARVFQNRGKWNWGSEPSEFWRDRRQYSLVENIVDLLANEGTQPQELPVDAVQHRLQEVTLARILRVEQVEQLQHEIVIDVPLGDVRLKVGRLEEPQVQLVHELQVRPGRLQRRFVLLRIELGAVRIRRRRQRAEQVRRELRAQYGGFG